ncbi:MAG TPA: aldo/keto reductase [Holophagaceae bacterium]|nr:aldo/keto reductase [Holophagaceae bacterium]
MLALSPLGLGTYLGDEGPEADARYAAAAIRFHALGGNAFDTAANYRGGRSERALGRAFERLARESTFVSTKAGYLPMGDGITEESPKAWFQRVLLGPGILRPEEVIDGCHSLAPRYLAHQLGVSLEAMGLGSVNLFHLHNPEHARPRLGPRIFDEVLLEAFRACEALVADGKTEAYGVATWSGFRVMPDRPDHLSLERLLELAEQAGGRDHHFRWIQLPLNLGMAEAHLVATQSFGGRMMTPLAAAQAAGLHVQTSASMLQARVLPQIAEQLDALRPFFPGCESPAQMALQFTRSCPGVTVALCGMGQVAHVEENAKVLGLPPLDPASLAGLFG